MMIGPPGSGKTLLARAMPGILPQMTIDEALDVTCVYSVADLAGAGNIGPVHLAEALQYRPKTLME